MEKHLDSICGTHLWNPKSVYIEHPDFTFCFRYTLLVWIPCCLIIIGSPLWVYMISNPRKHKINVSWLLVTKTILLLALILIELINLVIALKENSNDVFFITPSVLIYTFVIILFITHYERINGWHNSSLVFLFWFFYTATSTLTLRSNIIYTLKKDDWKKRIENPFELTDTNIKLNKLKQTDLILFYVHYGLCFMSLVLSVLSEKYNTTIDFKNESPEEESNVLIRLTFFWINPLIKKGYNKDLTREDLWKIGDKECSETTCNRLESVWNSKANDYIKKIRLIDKDKIDPNQTIVYAKNGNVTLSQDETEIQKLNVTISDKTTKKRKVPEPSLALAMSRVYITKFIGIVAIKLAHDSLNFVKPLVLDKLITFINDKEQKLLVGLFYIFILCSSSFIQTLISQHYYHGNFILGNKMKIALMNIIYKKSLRLSNSARRETTVGEMTNLITTNSHTFEHCSYHLTGILSSPFQIIISSYLLYQYIGVATLVGLSSMIIFIPLNSFFANRGKKIRKTKYEIQDKRIKMMNEILNGIRIIKFYGWEESFRKLVKNLREKEIINLIKTSLLNALTSFTWSCAPYVVAVVSFATYLLINKNNNLNPNTAFVSLALFNMLRFPLNFLPYIIQGLVQLNVSLTRIRQFLLRDELNENDIIYLDNTDSAIKIENINFGWNKETENLKNINLDIKKQKLISIVGRVGSGKSSLLSAMLGEMHKLNENKIIKSGSTAYVPQQAWIENASIKNNILFGSPLDEAKYNQVLEACSLVHDLKLMPAGDETEIGEKGINLSGGQKQRVSLARSIYANADIYLLDDPLSAVDAHVGRHIFDEVIGPNGILKDKTRIFVTNSLSYLSQTDEVIMLENGQIIEKGSYEKLKNDKGVFSDFIKDYLSTVQFNQNKKKIEENEQELEKKENELNSIKEQNNDTVLRKLSSANKEIKKSKAGEKLIESEKIVSGHVKIDVILEYLKACRLWLSLIFILLSLSSYGCDLASDFWLKEWSEDNAEEQIKNKYFRLAIYALLGFLYCFVGFLKNLCFVGMFIKATKFLHNKLLYSVLRGTLRFFETTPSGRIINRFTKDVEATEDSIPYSIKSLIECTLSLFKMVIIISISTPLFIIALIPITTAYLLVQRYFVPCNRQLKRMQSASKSPIFSHFSETQFGISTIRAYGSQKEFTKRMQNKIDENLVYSYANTVSNRWLALRLELIGSLITIFAALFAIFKKDTLSAGLAGLSISTSLNVSGNLNWLVRTVSEFEVNITSIERLKEYFEIVQEAPWSDSKNKPTNEWPDKGEIILNEYSIKYREELGNVLDKITAKIKPGEKIGIVGRTGAGKSSLTLGLFRLLELHEGDIIIDNININKIGLHDLRHKLTIIPQDPIIFSGSIRMNLDPFGVCKDSNLWEALELAHLKEFVSSLEKKLDHECSEGGENLSVGQRQLICLARALLRKTKILVLDEATASIDHNTDELIQQTIRSQFSECTVLTIAHRLNTIMDSSRIMVLDKGKIVEFDTPSQLLSNKTSFFYSLSQDAGLL